MIATRVLIDLRRASELRRENHERVFQQTAALEIAQERSESFVQFADLLRQPGVNVIVHVPASETHLHKSHTVLNKTASQEAALAKIGLTIFALKFTRLLTEVKSTQVCAFHHAHRILVDVRVSAHGALIVSLFEGCIQFRREVEPIVKISLREVGEPLAVLKTRARIIQNQRLEASLKKATSRMLAITRDNHGAGKIRIALPLEFLQPGTHCRMARGAAQGVARVLKVVPLFMCTLGAGHAV